MIGLIDVDSKIPNLALMKISTYYKSLGEQVEFVQAGKEYEKIFASAIFTRSKSECERIQEFYGDKVEIGGTGWDIKKTLDHSIEICRPDYNLYTAEVINVLEGIRRDLCYGKDNVKRIRRVLNAKT